MTSSPAAGAGSPTRERTTGAWRTTGRLSMVVLAAAAVLLSAACVAAEDSGSVAAVHGLAPHRGEAYSADGVWCVAADGSADATPQLLPWSAINDGYCDCADAADEPGTAACAGRTPHATFHCPNLGSMPKDVPVSFVGDGVCDCCDGADEAAAARVACPNTCVEEGQEAVRRIRQRNRVVVAGATAKLQYIADGSAALAAARQLAQDKASDVDSLRDRLEAAKTAATDAETLEKIAKARQARLQRDRDIAEAAAAPASAPTDPASDSVEELAEDSAPEATIVPPSPPPPLEPLDTFETEEHGVEGIRLVPPGEEEAVIAAAAAARATRDELQREFNTAEREANEANDKTRLDVGPEAEFFPLVGKCVSFKTREYEYEVCPFKDARQKSLSGGSSTLLGSWGKWDPAYDSMLFENGAKCWNGPMRSLRVALVCGSDDELYAIDEPEKCTYTAVLATPAACDASHAAVADLSSPIAGVDYAYAST
ncbi:glucosidase 2 subunit beta [Thecamonas trahens ATCC 50062]|uniref:Glucosidase 2 subunit beta n=1 Tax=Thecamonas trahens ATCC 50062 TaxID=461836 RepID=A0A0L0DN19_THETB|nr:glucosidase 2 subunit beta [Thecamonas trahens ATCC 50062]KNC53650.1 glucosidase 2 subunit beta [Thecamonas trahens ATCC 50062]|eukprot:XP_013761965.1 glucosidase 2 subunit beta [Thecamonas trahens ATCC 50062]